MSGTSSSGARSWESTARTRLGSVVGSAPIWSRLGAALCLTTSAVTLLTAWLLPGHGRLVGIVAAELAAAVAAVAVVRVRPQLEQSSRLLLVFPLLVVAAVLADAVVSKSVGSTYVGYFTLCFAFVGYTQPRGTALWLAPVMAAVWWYCQSAPASVIAVKFPITLAVWMIISEGLALRSRSVRREMGRLANDASTDHLTGLGNRRGLEVALAALETHDTLVLLDLDHFKAVNDTFGHEAGDRVIRDFGECLRAVLRGGDLAFRYGGEEIVVILKHGDGSTFGATAMLRRLKAEWTAAERPTFSAGAAVHESGSANETLQRADVALYEAKHDGRNAWRLKGGRGDGASGDVPFNRAG